MDGGEWLTIASKIIGGDLSPETQEDDRSHVQAEEGRDRHETVDYFISQFMKGHGCLKMSEEVW